MKRVKFCIVIIAVLIIMSIGSVIIIKHECEELIAVSNEILVLISEDDKENALVKADELSQKWKHNYKVLRCITSNDKIYDVNELIGRITPSIEKDSEELTSDLNSIIYNLDFISNKEKPYIYNIF